MEEFTDIYGDDVVLLYQGNSSYPCFDDPDTCGQTEYQMKYAQNVKETNSVLN